MTTGEKFISQRIAPQLPLSGGQWYSGFSTVKSYAVSCSLPFVGMFTSISAERCDRCRVMQECLNTSQWKNYMKETDFIYWVGCDKDTSKDDKELGTGCTWVTRNLKYTTPMPIMRFYWKAKAGTVLADGTVLSADTVVVDKNEYGDDVRDNGYASGTGVDSCITYFKKIFKQYGKQYSFRTGRWYSNTPDDANQYGFDALSANFDHFIEYCEYFRVPAVIVHGQDLSGVNAFGQYMYFIADEQFYPQLVADGSNPLKSFKAFMRSSYGRGFAYFIETGDQETQAYRYVKDTCKYGTNHNVYKSKCAFGLIYFPKETASKGLLSKKSSSSRLNDIAPFYYNCCGVYQYYHNYVKSLNADYSYYLNADKYNVNYPTPVSAKLIIQTIRWAFSNYKTPSVDTYYTVKFLDYDETVLKTESVLSGGSATPPDDPVREGYDFTGWKPAYTDIVQDTTCYAKYEQQLCIDNGLASQLVDINFSEKMLSVGDYSFHDCTELTSVTGGKYLKFIGTDAFRNCTKLTRFSRFSDRDSSHTFNIVGNNAFDNTRLVELYLSLRGSSIYTFWGDYCFANNPSLTSVHFLSSSYMSNNMFYNCWNLKNVSYDNNYTSYVYPYVFRNCSALTSITLPNKIWFISEHMFDGCSGLKSVGFSDYGDGSKVEYIQRGAFSGCNSLTSIELPQSINSLSCMQDGCFSNIPKLRQITFHGIGYDSLSQESESVVQISSELGVMYENPSDFQQLVDNANLSSIPIVWFHSCSSDRVKKSSGDCVHCRRFNNYIDTQDAKDLLKQVKVLFVYDTKDCTAYTALKKRCVKAVDNPSWSYVMWGLEYTTKSGTVKRYCKQPIPKDVDAGGFNDDVPLKRIKEILSGWGYDYTQSPYETVVTTTIVDSLFQNGCFRLNHDVTLVSMEGKQINYVYDSNRVVQYEDPVEYVSDKTTTDNFKTGTWYYNSRQIKAYADKTGTPVLCIYSLLGCKPCQIYEANVWDNALFQEWVAKQNFLFCGMNVEQQPYYDSSLKYCTSEWSVGAYNYAKLSCTAELSNAFGEQFKEFVDENGNKNSNLFTPVLIFYHKPLEYSEPKEYYLYTYHNINNWLQQNGVEGVVQILQRLCLYHFDDNDVENPTYCVDVDRPFVLSDLGYEDYERYDKYYDSDTRIVNLTTYKSLSNLQSNFFDVFDVEGYIGGCGIGDFTFFGEVGVLETNQTEWNSAVDGVKWKFGTDYYSLSFNMSDTHAVKSVCNLEMSAIGYKTVWTSLDYRASYDMSKDGFGSLQSFKDKLTEYCAESEGEYIGGCLVEDFAVFGEMGLNSSTLADRGDYFNDVLDTYELTFSSSEKYRLQVDLSDSKQIRTGCEAGVSAKTTVYRLVWTPSN